MATVVKFVEILSTHSRKNFENWKFQGPVNLIFDENTKGYVLDCNGGSMKAPKKQGIQLKLIRPYLLIQVFMFPGKLLTIELMLSDSQGGKRRIMITQCKNVIFNMMHSRLPNAFIEKNNWLHLYINVHSLFSFCFPSYTFRSVDGITLNAFCKIRRIYSLSETDIDYLLPGGFELPRYINVKTQIITAESFSSYFQEFGTGEKGHKASSLSLPKIHIKKTNIFYNKESLSSIRASMIDVKSLEEKKEEPKLEVKKFKVGIKEKYKSYDKVLDQMKISVKRDENEVESSEKARGVNFYDVKIKNQLQHRHVTPPFVNIGDVFYNPKDRSYENSPDIKLL